MLGYPCIRIRLVVAVAFDEQMMRIPLKVFHLAKWMFEQPTISFISVVSDIGKDEPAMRW